MDVPGFCPCLCSTHAVAVTSSTFADPEKIRELARRGEALGTSEARQMLERDRHGVAEKSHEHVGLVDADAETCCAHLATIQLKIKRVGLHYIAF